MLYPSLDTLIRMVDSKYTLVVTAAKRAREITEGKTTYVVDSGSVKPVTIALQEIAEGRVTYERMYPAPARQAPEPQGDSSAAAENASAGAGPQDQ